MKPRFFGFVAFLILQSFIIASCTSSNLDLERQRAARLREQMEIERAKEEQRKRIEARKASEKTDFADEDSDAQKTKPLLAKKDTISVTTGKVTALALSPDSEMIACGTDDGGIKVFKKSGGIAMAVKEHKEAVRSLVFSDTDNILYSGGADENIMVWEIEARGKAPRKVRGFFRTVDALAFEHNARRLAAADAKKVHITDDRGHSICELKSSAFGIHDVVFLENGRSLAAGSDNKTIEIWDIGKREIKHQLERHVGPVSCLCVSADGKTLVSGGTDKLLITWKIDTGKMIRVLHGHRNPVTDVVFLPDGKRIISSDSGGWLIVRDCETGKILLRTRGHEKSIESIALANGQNLLYAASTDGSVSIWEINSSR